MMAILGILGEIEKSYSSERINLLLRIIEQLNTKEREDLFYYHEYLIIKTCLQVSIISR